MQVSKVVSHIPWSPDEIPFCRVGEIRPIPPLALVREARRLISAVPTQDVREALSRPCRSPNRVPSANEYAVLLGQNRPAPAERVSPIIAAELTDRSGFTYLMVRRRGLYERLTFMNPSGAAMAPDLETAVRILETLPPGTRDVRAPKSIREFLNEAAEVETDLPASTLDIELVGPRFRGRHDPATGPRPFRGLKGKVDVNGYTLQDVVIDRDGKVEVDWRVIGFNPATPQAQAEFELATLTYAGLTIAHEIDEELDSEWEGNGTTVLDPARYAARNPKWEEAPHLFREWILASGLQRSRPFTSVDTPNRVGADGSVTHGPLTTFGIRVPFRWTYFLEENGWLHRVRMPRQGSPDPLIIDFDAPFLGIRPRDLIGLLTGQQDGDDWETALTMNGHPVWVGASVLFGRPHLLAQAQRRLSPMQT